MCSGRTRRVDPGFGFLCHSMSRDMFPQEIENFKGYVKLEAYSPDLQCSMTVQIRYLIKIEKWSVSRNSMRKVRIVSYCFSPDWTKKMLLQFGISEILKI